MKTFNVTHEDNWTTNQTPIFNNGMRDVYEDTVYYDDSYTVEDVKRSLVEHDGYVSDITVEEEC